MSAVWESPSTLLHTPPQCHDTLYIKKIKIKNLPHAPSYVEACIDAARLPPPSATASTTDRCLHASHPQNASTRGTGVLFLDFFFVPVWRTRPPTQGSWLSSTNRVACRGMVRGRGGTVRHRGDTVRAACKRRISMEHRQQHVWYFTVGSVRWLSRSLPYPPVAYDYC